ncbi:pilus assembly protein [Actimicrobium antarcticum]|uniref:PilY1 beta-propeller domain-containing protein n=1 Tax=Actimicrobium antarcticum TaxID=1051899 RepID=A0ABP7TUX1_9BURK
MICRWSLLMGLLLIGVSLNAVAQLKFFECSMSQHGARPRLNVPPSSSASLTVSQQTVDETRRFLFRGGFESVDFSGSLRKYAVSREGAGTLALASESLWEVANQWAVDPGSQSPTASGRSIYTIDEGSGKTIGFTWSALSARQQKWLSQSPTEGNPDGLGERRVAYLRGVRSDETGQANGIFRPRRTILGAILNSTPVLSKGIRQDSSGAIYVGGNDGMLHAFSVSDGRELFAYIPGFLVPSLAQLTVPGLPPQPGFDGKLLVQDVEIRGGVKSILVGAAGAGGAGIVALDVSAPAQFGQGDQAGALWEFSRTDDPEMGPVISEPAIGRFSTSLNQSRYFVVVATGQSSGKPPGRLFLLALDKPPGAPWVLNVNYFKLAPPVSKAPSGLAAPALVTGDNGLVRFAYAGDLAGNLWRFDFSGAAPWQPARRLFSAASQGGKPQPIVTQPRVVFAPGGGYLILFGTGQLLAPEDSLPSGFAAQSFYAIRDQATPGERPVLRSDLAARTVRLSEAGTVLITGAPVDYGVGNTSRKGWFMDFPDAQRSGERQVDTAVVLSGQLAFRSLIPAVDGCDRGDGHTYLVGASSGLPGVSADATSATITAAAASTTRQAAPEPPLPLMLMYSDVMSPRNATGGVVVSRNISVPGSNSGRPTGTASGSQSVKAELPAGRLSWREIANWQEAHHASRQD